MGATKTGLKTSDNWTIFGAIPSSIQTTNFKRDGENEYFNIDNEGVEELTLTIRLANMTEFQPKLIRSGYNPLLIAEIQSDDTLTTEQIANLKWGY